MSAQPTPAEPAHAKLRFELDDMHNASVFLDDRQVYMIKSADGLSSTEVLDSAGKRVVKIAYHTIRSNTIQWHDREETKLQSWLPNRIDYPVGLTTANGEHVEFDSDPHQRMACTPKDIHPLP